MKFIEDKSILQRTGEPPRRFFTDSDFFDLYVWYKEPEKQNIAGFQLVYRANPFDTDHEYFISHFPSDPDEYHNSLGKSDTEDPTYAAHKLIKKTSDNPPESLFDKIEQKIDSLPPEIQDYIKDHILREN